MSLTHAHSVRLLRAVTGVIPALALLMTACASARPIAASPIENIARETQERISDHFHVAVLPKLEPCWRRLTGRGSVTLAHHYLRDHDRTWGPTRVDLLESTLPADQGRAAVACMAEAVKGSRLGSAPAEAAAKEYEVRLVWPVPLPTDRVSLTAEAPSSAFCDDCAWDEDLNARCVKRFVGWVGCRAEFNACTLILRRCFFGSVFGVVGVVAR